MVNDPDVANQVMTARFRKKGAKAVRQNKSQRSKN